MRLFKAIKLSKTMQAPLISRITTLFALLLCAALVMVFQPLAAAEEEEEGKVYHIGIIPTWSPVVTHTKWSPFAEQLSQATGLTFRLKVYEKMRDFERDIISPEAPDFIFANALQTVVAHEMQGFVPLVRGSHTVKAMIFVREDSPVKTIDDLADKRIAFVGEKNVCTIFLKRALSLQNEKMSFDTDYSGSTKNVIMQVLLGKADAGVSVGPAINRDTKDIPGQLRILMESSAIPAPPLCAHPRIPEMVQAAVRKGIFTLAETPEGKKLMGQVRMPAPMVADYERDYKALQSMDVKLLSNWGK